MKTKKVLLGFLTSCFVFSLSSLPVKAGFSQGGRVVIYSESEPANLLPIFNNSEAARNVYNLIYSGLLGIDDNFDYFPDLAVTVPTVSNRGVQINDQGMIVTYKLKDLVFWHDGVPITSEDIKFTWQCYINPNISKDKTINTDGYENIKSIETPDPKTIQIYFKEPYADYKNLFRYILPKHSFKGLNGIGINDKHPLNMSPVGSGPFKFMDRKVGNYLVLDRNNRYYKNRSYVDQVVIKYGGKIDSGIISEFNQGKIHIIQPDGLEDTRKINIQKSEENHKVVQSYIEEMAFNNQNSPMKDLNMRKAFAHLINKERVASEFNYLKPTWSDVHPNSNIFEVKLKESFPYDLKLSNYYFDMAGWRVDPRDGIRKNSQKQPLIIKLALTNSAIHQKISGYLKEVLSYTGINLDLKTISEEDYGSTKYDISLYKRPVTLTGAERVDYYSADKMPPKGHNFALFNNQRLQAIFSDPDKVTNEDYQKQINEILLEELPSLPLFNYVQNISVSKKLNNFRPNLMFGNTWNSSEWWLD